MWELQAEQIHDSSVGAFSMLQKWNLWITQDMDPKIAKVTANGRVWVHYFAMTNAKREEGAGLTDTSPHSNSSIKKYF